MLRGQGEDRRKGGSSWSGLVLWRAQQNHIGLPCPFTQAAGKTMQHVQLTTGAALTRCAGWCPVAFKPQQPWGCWGACQGCVQQTSWKAYGISKMPAPLLSLGLCCCCSSLNADATAPAPDPATAIVVCAAAAAPARLVDEMGAPIGPYRVWLEYAWLPGLAMSRALGDQLAHT